jgi:hypothetical protein
MAQKSRNRSCVYSIVFMLACVCAVASPAFGQRGGAHVGGVRPIAPPHVFVPHVFPVRPIYPLRPFFPIGSPGFRFYRGPYLGFGPGLGYSPFWLDTCGLYAVPGYGCSPYPVYFYGGGGREYAELVLKDGTVYNVTDYWLVNGQLHFTTVDASNLKVEEHTIDFGELDLQKTIAGDEQRGFRFVLRDEPIEQYLRNHPDGEVPSGQPTQ